MTLATTELALEEAFALGFLILVGAAMVGALATIIVASILQHCGVRHSDGLSMLTLLIGIVVMNAVLAGLVVTGNDVAKSMFLYVLGGSALLFLMAADN